MENTFILYTTYNILMIKINRNIIFLSFLMTASISLTIPNIQSSYADSSERFKETLKECKEDFSGIINEFSEAVDTFVGTTCIGAGLLDEAVLSLTKE